MYSACAVTHAACVQGLLCGSSEDHVQVAHVLRELQNSTPEYENQVISALHREDVRKALANRLQEVCAVALTEFST